MAFANALPWHGLGNRVDASSSVEEMTAAAGLDWKVEQHPCFAEMEGEKIDIGRKALIRDTDKKILTITGDNWKPLQNSDAIGFFRDYMEMGGAKLETAGSLRGGKVIWGLAALNKGYTLKGGDVSKGYILITSPHEVGKAITVRATAVRVVCANTLALASRDTIAYRQSHHKQFNFDDAKKTVDIANQQIAQLAIESEALQGLKMSEFDTVRALSKFFQPMEKNISKTEEEKNIQAMISDPCLMNKKLSEIMVSVNTAAGATPENAWGVLNGVTHWADHVAGRERDARLFRSWLGTTGTAKEQVKNHLLEMV